MQKEETAKVKSLGRALRLLECFTTQESEWGVTELAEKMNMAKSNAHSIISTFEQMGYLRQLPNKKYTLGFRMLEYSFAINQNLGYPKAVYDLVQKTATLTEQIVYFGIPYGTKVLYLYVAHPVARMKDFPYREILGETAPLCSTGIGKAILAHLPEEEWSSRIDDEITSFTRHTITDREGVMEELRRTRTRGYAVDNEEREIGRRCVGVPVFNSSGQLVAGMSTSGPTNEMTDYKMLECANILTSAASQMKERIYR